MVLKFAPKLSKRAINIISFDKQKVSLMLAIFDETTAAGVKSSEFVKQQIESKDEDLTSSTSGVLSFFIKIWKIMNIKNFIQGSSQKR